MSLEAPTRTPGRVQSVDRAAELLTAIADSTESQTAPALADLCGLNRSTAWRLLDTLEQQGLVARDPETNRYGIGLSIVRLAASAGHNALVWRARPLVRQLARATGESVNLAIIHGLDLVYADQVDGAHIMAPNWLGRRFALHATSTGKAFLAALPDDQLEAAAPPPLEALTETTITNHQALREALNEIRRAGYATSEGELESHLWGVSVAIVDRARRPVAVLSVWGAESRVRDRLPDLAHQCLITAAALSDVL